MSEVSHLKNRLLAEQVEDQIYHYILDTPSSSSAHRRRKRLSGKH